MLVAELRGVLLPSQHMAGYGQEQSLAGQSVPKVRAGVDNC